MKIMNSALIIALLVTSFSIYAYIRNPNGEITYAQNELVVSGLPINCAGTNWHGVCRRFAHSVLRRADWKNWYSVSYSCAGGWEHKRGYEIDLEGSIKGTDTGAFLDTLTCTNQ